MWLGPNTDDCYEDIFSLVCEKHKDNKHEIRSKNKILKMLKETVVTMRVKSMSFLLEDQDACEIFESRTFRLWLADHQIFPSEFKFSLDQKKCHKEVVLLIDSVMVFTMALFSKICSICTKIKRIWDLNSHREKQGSSLFPEDKKKIFEYILSANENHPHYLSVRKAFQGYDRVTVDFAFVVAYYTFITTFGDGISVGQYLKDTNDDFNIQRMLDVIHEVNHMLINKLSDVAFFQISSELRMNHYFSILYENGAHVAMIEKDFACAELCCRFALVLDMECCHSFFMLTSALLAQKEIHRAHATAAFASKQCKVWTCKHCVTLKKVAEEFKKMCEECNPEEKPSVLTNAKEKAASSRSASKYSSFKEIFDSIGLNAEVVCKLLNLTEETPNGCVGSIVKNESEMDQHVKVPASEQCRDQKNLILTRPKVKKPDKDNFVKKQEVTSELKQPEGCSMCAIEKEAEKADRIENSDKLAIEKALLEGRCAIKTGCMEKAVSHFSEVLNMIKKSPKLSETLKIDATAIKFVYGYTCFKCFTFENMNRAITIFKEIIDSGAKHVAAVHYFLGLSFSKFQKFQTALTYFETATSMKKEEFNFNLFALLDENSSTEFKYENIQVSLKDEIAKCECPPPPDAICRYDTCNFDTSIYFSGLSFKKCTCLHCQERCVLQYHFTCWKLIKESSAKTEKDFLDSPCLTPDCIGLIIKIEIIKKNGEVEKEFVSKEDSRPKRHGKSKKMDMEEKTEQKERERKESRSRTISKNFEDEPELVSDGKHSKESVKSQGYKNDAHEKFSVENEVLKCKSFPHPDAVCRYESCNQNREIYFSHLSSEVFICVRCQKQCAIEYHVPCWKAQKKALCKIDDDEFLDSACFTPDCDSVITKIDVFGRDGVWERHFTSKDNYKPKTKKRVKQRKLKLEKKQEQKERKKQEVLSLIMSGNFEPSSDESEPTIENSLSTEPHAGQVNEMPIKNRYHRKVSDNNYALAVAGNAKPSTSNVNAHKKEHNSISPKKEQKRPKIFSSPPKDFGNWSETYIAKSPVTSLSEFIDFEVSSKIDTASKTDDLSDIWCYKDELKTMIISHFLNFLRCHGFISLTDPKLDQEIHKLPKDAIDVINEEGGFYEFFCDFTEFEFVNGNFCLYSDVRDLCEFDDSICEMSPSKVQEDVHISAGSRNITKIQATANQDNLLENDLCQKEYNSKDISGAVEVSACNRSATHKISKHVPSGARNQTISMSSYTEEYESSAESDPEDYYSRSSYFSKIDASHSPKLFELKENPLSSNAAGKKHHLDSDDVNKKSETVPKFLKDNVEDNLNEIGWKNRNGYETGRSLTEPKNYMDEICQLSQFVPSQEKSAAFEVNATDQAEASIKIEKKKKESASKQKVPEVASKQKVPEVASKQKVPEAASKQKVPEAASKQKVPEAASKQKVPEAASKQKVPEAASKQKVPEAASKQKVPEAAAKQKVPEAATKQKVPEAAAKQKVPEAAAKQKVPEAAAKQKVPEAAAKQKAKESVSEQKIQIPIHSHHIDKETESHIENKILHIQNTVTDKYEKEIENEIVEESAGQSVSLRGIEEIQNAELEILDKKRVEYLKVFEAALLNAETNVQDLKSGLTQMEYMYRFVQSTMNQMQDRFNEYIIDLYDLRNTFNNEVTAQIEKIKSGALLSQLEKLDVPMFPPLPTIDSVLCEVNLNQTSPNAEGAATNAQSQLSTEATSPQGSSQFPSEFMQSCYSHMFQQNLLITKNSGVYSVNDNQTCKVPSLLQTTSAAASVQEQHLVTESSSKSVPVNDFFNNSTTVSHQNHPQAPKSVDNVASCEVIAKSPPLHTENMQPEIATSSKISQSGAKSFPEPNKTRQLKCSTSEISQDDGKSFSQQMTPLHETKHQKSSVTSEISESNIESLSQIIKPFDKNMQPKSGPSSELQGSIEFVSEAINQLHENVQSKNKTSSETSQTGAESLPQTIKPLKNMKLKEKPLSKPSEEVKSLSQVLRQLSKIKKLKSTASSEISIIADETLPQAIKPVHESMQPKSKVSSEISKSLPQAIKPVHESMQPKSKVSSEISKSLPQAVKPVHENIQPKSNASEISQTSAKSVPQTIKPVHENIQPKSDASSEISQTSAKSLPQTIKPLHKSMQPKNKSSTEIFQSDAKSSSRVSCESISSGSFYDYEDSASIKSSLIFSNSVEKGKSEIEFVNEKSAKKSNPVDDAAASMVMAKTERIRTMCKKIIHAVKQEFPNAKDSEIMTYVKQYRTEKGGKLPSVTLATIVADVKEIMMRTKKKVANMGTSSQVEYPVCSNQGTASAADTKIRTVVPEPKNFHAATSEYINACKQPTCSASSSLKSSSSDQMAHLKGKTLSELYTKKQAEDTAKLQSFFTHSVMDAKKMLIGSNGAQHDRNTTHIKSATTESALKHCDNDPRKGNSRSASKDRKTEPQRIGASSQVEYPVCSLQGAASAANTKIRTVVPEPKNFHAATSEYINACKQPACSASSSLKSSSSDQMAHPKGKTLSELYTKKQAEDTVKLQSFLTHFVMDAKKMLIGTNGAQHDRNTTLIKSATTESALKHCDNDPGKGNSRSASEDRKTDPQRILTYPKLSRQKKLTNKPLTSCSKPKPPPKTEKKKPSFCPWAKVPNPEDKSNGDYESSEHVCCICFEEMTILTARTTDCGHKFHLKCIKAWCDKQSDCPICRAHLLLYEDFPILS